MLLTIAAVAALVTSAAARFDVKKINNMATVAGTVSSVDGSGADFSDACAKDSKIDGIMVPVINMTKWDGTINSLEFLPTDCGDSRGEKQLPNGMQTCYAMGNSMDKCHDSDKKVFAVFNGLRGFKDDDEAKKFADQLWKTYGAEGKSTDRIFGNFKFDGIVAAADTNVDSKKTNWDVVFDELNKKYDDKDYYNGVIVCGNDSPSAKKAINAADFVVNGSGGCNNMMN